MDNTRKCYCKVLFTPNLIRIAISKDGVIDLCLHTRSHAATHTNTFTYTGIK